MKKHEVSNTTVAVLLILAILVSVIGAWTVVEHANQKIEKVRYISVMENSNPRGMGIRENLQKEDITKEDINDDYGKNIKQI